MFKVRYKGQVLNVYHVEPRLVLQFLVYCEKEGLFKSSKKCFQCIPASECEEVK